jgi:RimJ/RimL family protein N-acetyltransferase
MTLLEDTSRTFYEACTPVLATERLLLRAPRREDVKQIALIANDRRVAENLTRLPHPYTPADAEQWIATTNIRPGDAHFAVEREGSVVGVCSIEQRDGSDSEIGYWFGVPFWRMGYATEAVRALIDHAFEAGGHSALVAGSRVSNPGSRRVLEKCGFQWTGVALYRVRALQSSAPCDRFRLERPIWASLKSWGARKVA